MRLRAWKLFLLSIAFVLAAALPPALAQSPSDSELKALKERANTLFQAGKYRQALRVAEEGAIAVEKAESIQGAARPLTADALGNVAWYALFAQQPQKALKASERALSLAPHTLWMETNRAHALLFSGRTSQAVKVYVGHKGETVQGQGKWEEVVLKDFAEFRVRGHDLRQFKTVEWALAKAPKSPGAELDAIGDRAAALWKEGKYDDALHLAEQVVAGQKARYGDNSDEYATALVWLVDFLIPANRLAEAEPVMRRALKIDEAALGPNHPDVAIILNRMAKLLEGLEQYAESEQLRRRALKIDEISFGPDHPRVAVDLNNLAIFLEEFLENYTESERLKRRALKIHEAVLGPDDPAVAIDLNNLAQLLQTAGRLDEAEPLMRRALKIHEASLGPDHPNVAMDLGNLAGLLRGTNRLAEAEPLFRRALKVYEAALGPDHPNVALAVNNLAIVLRDTNRLAEAEPLFRRALSIFEKRFGTEDDRVALTVSNLAALLTDTNRLAEAEPLMRRALKHQEARFGPDHPKVAEELSNLGMLLQKTNRLAEAESLLRRAVAIDEKSFGPGVEIVHLTNLAMFLEDQGHWSESVALLAQARRQSRNGFRVHTRALYRADASNATNRADGFLVAQVALKNEAADALTSMSVRFAKGTQQLAKLVREQQDLLAARKTAYRRLDTAAGEADAKAAEAARNAITQIEAKLAEKQAALHEAFPGYAELVEPKPLSLADAQALLGDGDALVLFLDLRQFGKVPEETIVFALTKDEARWISLPFGTRALAERVTALRCGLDSSNWRAGRTSRATCKTLLGTEAAKDQPPPFDAAAAHELYRDLFGGIEDLIKERSLLIVPSGALTQLPFEVLVTKEPDAKLPRFEAYKRAAWLGQRQAITILPSVGSLRALRTARASEAPAPFIGFGNPLLTGYDGTDKSAWAKQDCGKAAPPERSRVASLFEGFVSLFRDGAVNVESLRQQMPLPETADELCGVAGGLGVSGPQLDKAVYLGERATVSQVKALSKSGELARARVVHFATHGLLAGQTAMFAKNKTEPALLLTPPAEPGEEDNGLLTASEVAQLNLNADWVVMSACNTAAGSNEGAEALSGLARAFFYAGARSLLVSHWAVDSEAAVAITTGAVNAMKAEPKIGRAEALRRSIAALIAKGGDNAHPSVWAPFVLVGNGEQ
ncbi:MAG: tetratricopeptide repeat protein [Rhodomicrobium sp.]